MKNLKKIVLVSAICLVAPLSNLFAGFEVDSVTGENNNTVGSGGAITAPEGATVFWEVHASKGYFYYGDSFACIQASGALSLYASAASLNDEDGSYGYEQFPEGGGTVGYSLYAYGYDGGSAFAEIACWW